MIIQAQLSLPNELFNELNRRAPQPESRSTLIAEALRYFLPYTKIQMSWSKLINMQVN